MLTTSDLKKGNRIELDGQPWVVVQSTTQSPSARGQATLVKARLRNPLTGQISDRTFKAGEKFKEPDLNYRPAQFLYAQPNAEGTAYHFMDAATYEQFELTAEALGDDATWLTENLEVRAVEYNGAIVAVELPAYVEVGVDSVEPGARGDTATGSVTTAAWLTNGAKVQVPLFIKGGDVVRIETATGTFKDRVSQR